METKRLMMQDKIDKNIISEAAHLLQKGEVVAFPTETVYGLGADATNEAAIEKIFIAKGRPSDNPLIVHIATKAQLFALVEDYPTYVEQLIDTFSPGPITYVLKSNGKVATNVTAGLATVGVRIPNNEVALALLEECAIPIAAPSANLSGKPSPTSASHVLEDLDGKIAAVVDRGYAEVGLESTVVDCTGDVPIILRLGQITKQDIENIVGKAELISENKSHIQPKSPGLKYKHYAPEVPLILVENNSDIQRVIFTEQEKGNRVGALVSSQTAKVVQADTVIPLGYEEKEMAMNLYHSLRSIRKSIVDVVICESLPRNNVGDAVMDRLQRAATKII